MYSQATYSDCERYRYTLSRIWAPSGRKVLFLLLNPSTATEVQNDPTVERCERRARSLGYGAFMVCNIFAYRATDPRDMRAAKDPVGPDNDAAIKDAIAWADDVVAGWGNHGSHLQRGNAVQALLKAQPSVPKHLGLTKSGQPKHPLYIGYKTQPEAWW